MTTARRLILGLGLLVLAGCTSEAPDAAGLIPLSASERADCVAAGGKVDRGGLFNREICFRPEPDAGKSCRKEDDCNGFCMADSGTCSVISPQFGCFDILNEDGARIGLCLD